MRWRKWNYVLHRDLGYLCVGLTLIYAISGVVVNHTAHDFNPSYIIEKVNAKVSPLVDGSRPDMAYVNQVLTELGEQGSFKNVAHLSADTIRIFVQGNNIDVNLVNGMVLQEKVSKKPVFFEVNFLHLNKHKGVWTWIADGYAVALCLLGLSGLLMIRGKNKARGIILTLAGILLPLVFLLLVL